MSGTTVINVSDESHFTTLTSSLPSTSLVVVYFHAPWAAPCAQMSTVLETLASTYPPTEPASISFLSINAEELPELSETYDVTAVPYIVLQRAGKTLDTISGSDAAKVRTSVEKHYGGSSKTNGVNLPPAQQVTRPTNQPAPQQPTADIKSNGTPKDASTDAHSQTQTSTSAINGTTTSDAEPQDLYARLEQLTTAAPVMLFMKGTPSAPQCGFSRQLVSILRENSVRYGFFNILADEEVRQGLKEFADWPTFPQLWMDGDLVGGLDIVREEMSQNANFFDGYSVGKKQTGDQAAAAGVQSQPTAA